MDNIEHFEINKDFYGNGYRRSKPETWEQPFIDKINNGKVLDIGCGGGRLDFPLLDKGVEVMGLDIVKACDKFDIFVGDMKALPFMSESFDYIVCANTINFLSNQNEVALALKEMHRVLKPKGVAFITAWNILHPLWGASIVLNYLIHDSFDFGQTSPLLRIDHRIVKRKVFMYVPAMNKWRELLYQFNARISCKPFATCMVIEATKRV